MNHFEKQDKAASGPFPEVNIRERIEKAKAEAEAKIKEIIEKAQRTETGGAWISLVLDLYPQFFNEIWAPAEEIRGKEAFDLDYATLEGRTDKEIRKTMQKAKMDPEVREAYIQSMIDYKHAVEEAIMKAREFILAKKPEELLAAAEKRLNVYLADGNKGAIEIARLYLGPIYEKSAREELFDYYFDLMCITEGAKDPDPKEIKYWADQAFAFIDSVETTEQLEKVLYNKYFLSGEPTEEDRERLFRLLLDFVEAGKLDSKIKSKEIIEAVRPFAKESVERSLKRGLEVAIRAANFLEQYGLLDLDRDSDLFDKLTAK